MGYINPFIFDIFKKHKDVEPSAIDKFIETANKTWNRFDEK